MASYTIVDLPEVLGLQRRFLNATVPHSAHRLAFLSPGLEGAAGDTYAAVLPGFHPFAFANPVFVDVSGDGWRYGEP